MRQWPRAFKSVVRGQLVGLAKLHLAKPLLATGSVVFSQGNTMRAAKFAISVPAETMTHVDRAAKRLGMTRSGYIAAILARVATRERDLAVSRKVDEVLADLHSQDLESAADLRAAGRAEGTEW